MIGEYSILQEHVGGTQSKLVSLERPAKKARSVFFFQHLKSVILVSSGIHCFQWEINHFYCCSLCLFYLADIKIFSLSLVFSNLTVMCLHVIFFVYILLGIFRTFWIWRLLSFINFGKFLGIIFSKSFFNLFSLFWRSNYMYIRPLDFVPQIVEALFFKNLFFLLYFSLDNLYWLYLQFHRSFTPGLSRDF